MDNISEYPDYASDKEFIQHMYSAAKCDSLESVERFYRVMGQIERGSVSLLHIKHETILQLASEHSDTDLFNIECQHNTDHWISPLYLAIYLKSYVMITTLVRKGGVNLKSPLEGGGIMTAIEYSCLFGGSGIIKLLLDLGCDVTGQVGVHCLQLCLGNEEAMRMLIAKGADVNGNTANGERLVCYALEREFWSMKYFRLMLNLGADVIGQIGLRCMKTCISRRGSHFEKDAFRLLIAKGADVNGTDENGVSHLASALRKVNSVARDILFESGADIESIRDVDLYDVCCSASSENVQFILDKKTFELSTHVKALELLGACCIVNANPRLGEALSFWAEAAQLCQGAEPSYTHVADCLFLSPSGVEPVDVPRTAQEILALHERPADAYLLALMIICMHRAPTTCRDIESQVMLLPCFIDHFPETRNLNPQSLIDIRMRHLKILILSRKQNASENRGGPNDFSGTKNSPYRSSSVLDGFTIYFKDTCSLLKLYTAIQEGLSIENVVIRRWIIDGLDILETLLEESECCSQQQNMPGCLVWHSMEEDVLSNKNCGCTLMRALTTNIVALLAVLHNIETATTPDRLNSLTSRFFKTHESNSYDIMMNLSRAIHFEASLAMTNSDSGKKENLNSFGNPYLALFLNGGGADPMMRDEAGDTPLHTLAYILRMRKSINREWNREEDWQLSDAIKPVVKFYARMLLKSGAHADARNIKGQVACQLLEKLLPDEFDVFQYQKLQCLAARVLRAVKYPLGEMPEHLAHFVSIH